MKWIIENWEVLFSGIGVAIIGWVISKNKKTDNLPDNSITQIAKEHSVVVNSKEKVVVDQSMHVHNELVNKLDKPHESANEEVDLLLNKFFDIYNKHGINRVELPGFIDSRFSITLEDVQDSKKMILKISDELIEWTCETFGIRKSYFYDTSSDATLYDIVSCYKWLSQFTKLFIDVIEEHGIYSYDKMIDVYFLKTFSEFEGDDTEGVANISVIFAVNIGKTPRNIVKKYVLVSSSELKWSYWKSRRDVKKMIRIADRFGVRVHGYDITEDEYYKIASRKIVPTEILSKKLGYTWYPDDHCTQKPKNKLEDENSSGFYKELQEIDEAILKIKKEYQECI